MLGMVNYSILYRWIVKAGFYGLLVIFPLVSFGANTSGVSISWISLGNNVYSFKVQVVMEASTPGLKPNVFGYVKSDFLPANLPLGEISHHMLNAPCGNDGNMRPTWVLELASPSVTINPTHPGPWSFNAELWGFNTNELDNISDTTGFVTFHAECVMFPAGRNRNSPQVDLWSLLPSPNDQYLYLNPYSTEGDSLVFGPIQPRFRYPITLSWLPYTPDYSPGYSAANPTHPQDQWFPQSGVFKSGLSRGDSLSYVFSARVDGYRDGVLASRVKVMILHRPKSISHALWINHPPEVTGAPVRGRWTRPDSISYMIKSNLGDTISLDLHAIDNDRINNGPYQKVCAVLRDNQFKGTSYIRPIITPISGQGSLSNVRTNDVRLEWVIPENLPKGYYRMEVNFTDSVCPYPSTSSVPIIVYNSGIYYKSDTLCAGEDVDLRAPYYGDTYSWMPSTGLSSSSDSVVTAMPTQSTRYTLRVDGDSVAIYDVVVDPNITPVLSNPSGNDILLTNPQGILKNTLFYYYYPIAANDTLYPNSVNGMYHMWAGGFWCENISDSLLLATDGLSSNHTISQFMSSSDLRTFDAGDVYRMGVRVGLNEDAPKVRQIIIPGAQMNNAIVKLKISQFMKPSFSVVGADLGGHSTIFELDSATYLSSYYDQISLEVLGGTIDVPVIFDQSMPFAFRDVNVSYVRGSLNGDTLTDDIIPFVFRGEGGMSLDEEFNTISIYPQPVREKITIRDDQHVYASYVVLSINGVEMCTGQLKDSNVIDVSMLPAGVYVLALKATNRYYSMQFVKMP